MISLDTTIKLNDLRNKVILPDSLDEFVVLSEREKQDALENIENILLRFEKRLQNFIKEFGIETTRVYNEFNFLKNYQKFIEPINKWLEQDKKEKESDIFDQPHAIKGYLLAKKAIDLQKDIKEFLKKFFDIKNYRTKEQQRIANYGGEKEYESLTKICGLLGEALWIYSTNENNSIIRSVSLENNDFFKKENLKMFTEIVWNTEKAISKLIKPPVNTEVFSGKNTYEDLDEKLWIYKSVQYLRKAKIENIHSILKKDPTLTSSSIGFYKKDKNLILTQTAYAVVFLSMIRKIKTLASKKQTDPNQAFTDFFYWHNKLDTLLEKLRKQFPDTDTEAIKNLIIKFDLEPDNFSKL